jgi:hypothetical protein
MAQPIVMKKLTPHLDKAIFASCVLSKAFRGLLLARVAIK